MTRSQAEAAGQPLFYPEPDAFGDVMNYGLVGLDPAFHGERYCNKAICLEERGQVYGTGRLCLDSEKVADAGGSILEVYEVLGLPDLISARLKKNNIVFDKADPDLEAEYTVIGLYWERYNVLIQVQAYSKVIWVFHLPLTNVNAKLRPTWRQFDKLGPPCPWLETPSGSLTPSPFPLPPSSSPQPNIYVPTPATSSPLPR
jgi:hypothetical protein